MRDAEYTVWFDRLSLPLVFLLTVLFVLLAIVVGAKIGAFGKQSTHDGKEAIGSVVGATLGLLAFILAFTFGMTASRYDARKQLLLEEVNAIGTTYLRAGLLPEPHRSQARSLLSEYVDLRVKGVEKADTVAHVLARSEQIQGQLWSEVEQMNELTPVSVAQVLFIQSLNDTIDLQTKRATVALQYRVPATIWVGLYLVALFAMTAVGYQFAQSGHRQLLASIMLALSFSSVLTLVADLDRAGEGTVRLNQQPLYHLQEQLHASP